MTQTMAASKELFSGSWRELHFYSDSKYDELTGPFLSVHYRKLMIFLIWYLFNYVRIALLI